MNFFQIFHPIPLKAKLELTRGYLQAEIKRTQGAIESNQRHLMACERDMIAIGKALDSLSEPSNQHEATQRTATARVAQPS